MSTIKRIYHLSDSHGFHFEFKIPDVEIDIVIHSGDESNHNIPAINHGECLDFLEWYSQFPAKYKILVAGNHSTAIANGLVSKKTIESFGIIYLENEYVEIEGIKIFGSPYTPTFGTWAFMKARNTINRLWNNFTDPADILVLHGPPKGILDLSYSQDTGALEKCGDNSLHKMITRMKPQLVLFGHIHDNKDNYNFGIMSRNGVTYSNAAAVVDGKFNKGIVNHGNLLFIRT